MAYRMIPGAFLSVFCWEIRKACSMDLPTGFRSYIMEPEGKAQDSSKSWISSERWGDQEREEKDQKARVMILSLAWCHSRTTYPCWDIIHKEINSSIIHWKNKHQYSSHAKDMLLSNKDRLSSEFKIYVSRICSTNDFQSTRRTDF